MPDSRLHDLHPNWQVHGVSLTRSWQLNDFAEALQLVNAIGEIAEAHNHHPDVEFGWGYVRLRLTTHDTGTLSERDFALATALDLGL